MTPSSNGLCNSSVADVSLVGASEGEHGSAGAAHWNQISRFDSLWVLTEAQESEVSNILASTSSDQALLQLH